ncbi:MAG: GDSL-type esterase/lipase family protein [Verrucomicrobiales bacterium]|nr:GDSL-type esterase/lipase family protein [Verrucomicrobiales bacterium]
MKYLSIIITSLAITGLGHAEESVDIEKYRSEVVKKWESEIQKLEEKDKTEVHPDDSILFVGSSSIRIWNSIAADLAPYHPIQRGFGGSKFSDVAIYADRLITPHQFRAVVLFVGNDIAGNETDKTPEEVAALFSFVHRKIRAHNPEAAVFYIGVTPTASRAKVWDKAKAANSLIREICLKTDNTWFIGTESIFLDGEGNSKTGLFKSDKLHLNEEGYKLWAAAIKSHLDTVFNGAN